MPAFLADQFIAVVRAGRPVLSTLPSYPVPPGHDSITIPKMSTGTTVAKHATQNTNVSMTDLATTALGLLIGTFAGAQVVSQQLVNQSSGPNVDELVLGDLAAAYATAVGADVLTNATTCLLTVATAQTSTQASPTVGDFVGQVGKAVATIAATRKASPTHIAGSPARWAWLTAATDGQGRPLVLPADGGVNALGVGTFAGTDPGVVGVMQGLKVVVDPNIPTNLGAGTNQDTVLIYRADDLLFFESDVRAEAFPQTYAQQLLALPGLRVQRARRALHVRPGRDRRHRTGHAGIRQLTNE